MRRVNVSLDDATHNRARALGLNVSEIAGAALQRAVQEEEKRLWRAENASVLAAQDQWLERNGHPLAGALSGPLKDGWREPEV